MKILIADDDAELVDTTAFAMRREGFNIIVAHEGEQALKRWQSDTPDLVLLDLWMPRVNGLEVCRQIRQGSSTPVIMLTAARDEEHIVQCFRSGADDYVTKPLSPKQLAMRIRAVLRRSQSKAPPEKPSFLQVGRYRLDVETHQVTADDFSIYLTPREFRILFMLMMNEARVVSFQRLVEFTWGYGQEGSAMLKTHVCHIRKKLKMEPGKPGYIKVINGVGYALDAA